MGTVLEPPDNERGLYLDHVYRQLDAKLVGILSVVGAILQRMESLQHDVAQLTLKTDHALLTPEEKEKKLQKAKEIVEKMKKEAEEEIEMEIARRRAKGIGQDGNALTDAERLAWEAGHELPE